ncbi:MAG: Rrf2 family transcriptional regulator [Burkholderiales bacterium]|nr:Rrf2 family transcriptional regulator [Burkholderiales bacterium]
MRLAEYTDYTLRVLMYCAARPQERVTIAEIAERHALSKNHLMKVVNDLGRQGLLETTRGRGGGLRLLADPTAVRVGDVVRACETDFRLVECFDPAVNECSLTSGCRLKQVFDGALSAFLRELDGATLAEISEPPARPRAGAGVAAKSRPGVVAMPVPKRRAARAGGAR